MVLTSGDGVTFSTLLTQQLLELFKIHLATQADLNETSLEQSLIDIAAMTDERGLRIAAKRS